MQDRKSPRSPWRHQSRRTTNESAGHRVICSADQLYGEFKEPLHSPPPLLLRMVDAGLLGKKTGRGFHDYTH